MILVKAMALALGHLFSTICAGLASYVAPMLCVLLAKISFTHFLKGDAVSLGNNPSYTASSLH